MAAARAWLRMAKYAPRTRRRNTSEPSPNATAIGSSTVAGSANHGLANGRHQTGSSSSCPYSCMKSGIPPGPASASLRCMAIA